MLRLTLLLIVSATACSRPAAAPARADRTTPTAPRPALALTYLGVAGWQIDGGDVTVLVDPYFSRPALDGPIRPDPAAIAARAPARANLVLVGHSHVDHLLDAPEVARRTGAEILGSVSTARVALASGLPADRVIPVRGGEDYAFGAGLSVRVIPSLHSALDGKHFEGGVAIPPAPVLPMGFDDYADGGALAYLVRVAGREIFVLSTANFIEREVEGLRPDIAIVATGLRQEIHDYTCRLMRALGNPPLVYVNHFDDWRAPPAATPPGDDLRAFVAEVARCSPSTRVVIPRHFDRMTVP